MAGSLSEILITLVANGQQYSATLKQAAVETQAAAAEMNGSLTTIAKGHEDAGKSAEGLGSKLKNLAKDALTNIALFTSYYLSVGAIKTVLGGAIEELRAFDENMRNVQSITLESDARIASLSKQLLIMVLSGKSAGASASELADAMYELVSAGYSSTDAMTLARIAAEGAAAGLTTTAATSKALLAILQAYKLPVSAATDVMNQLFTIVDLGVLHFNDLVTGMGYVIPTASALGISIQEVGAAIELLTRQGQQPSRVMTNLNDVMTKLLKPNAALSAEISKLGYDSGQAMVNAVGFAQSIVKISEAAAGSNPKLAQWFGDVRAIRAILPLAANSGRDFIAMLDAHNNEAAEGDRQLKALEQQQKSFNYQIKELTSNLKAVGVAIIGSLTVPFAGVIKVINDLFTKLVVFNSKTQESEFIWDKYKGTIDTIKQVLGALALLIVAQIIPAFLTWITSLNLVIGIGGTIAGAFSPLGILVGVVLVLAEHFGLLGKAIESLKSGGVVLDAIKGLVIGIGTALLVAKVQAQIEGVTVALTAMRAIDTSKLIFGLQMLFGQATTNPMAVFKSALGGVMDGLKGFLTSGPGIALAVTGIYVGLSQLAKTGAVADNVKDLAQVFTEFDAELAHISKTANGELEAGILKEAAAFTALSRAAQDTVDHLSHITDVSSILGDWAHKITTLDFTSQAKRMTDTYLKDVQDGLNKANLSIPDLNTLSQQLRDLASNPDNAKYSDMFLKADDMVQRQLQHLTDVAAQELAVKEAQGDTNQAIEDGNKYLDDTLGKVETWAKNLEPVQKALASLVKMMTPEKAAADAQIASLESQLANLKPLADAEKAERDAQVKGLEAEMKAIDLKNKKIKDSITANIALKQSAIDAQEQTVKNLENNPAASKQDIQNAKDKLQSLKDQLKVYKDQTDEGYKQNQLSRDDMQARIDGLKAELGPNETLSKEVKDQLSSAKDKLDITDKQLAKEAAIATAKITQSLYDQHMIANQHEVLFLTKAAADIWAGNKQAVADLADKMGITQERAKQLTGEFLSTGTQIDATTQKVNTLADTLHIPRDKAQLLYDKFVDLNKFGPFDQKTFDDYALSIGVPNTAANNLLTNLKNIDTQNVTPHVNSSQIDSAKQKAQELLNYLAKANNMTTSEIEKAQAKGVFGPAYAEGGVVYKEVFAHIAEGDKPEAIIPLTNVARAREILGQLSPDFLNAVLPSVASSPSGSAYTPSASGGGGPLSILANFNLNGATLDMIEQQLYTRMQEFIRQLRVSSQQRGTALNGRLQL